MINANEIANSKIKVRDLNFYYGKFHALKNISLDIEKNKVTAFIYHQAAVNPHCYVPLIKCMSCMANNVQKVKFY